jgi:hypothetical protein
MNNKGNNKGSTTNYAKEAAQAAQAAQAVYIAERGEAEQKAQAATNAAVFLAADGMHKGNGKLTPKAVGSAILRAVKELNAKAEKREQVPASRISRALKAVHIEGWTEEGKGCSVRVHKAKETAADIVGDLISRAVLVIDGVNDANELDKIEKLIFGALRAKRQAITK